MRERISVLGTWIDRLGLDGVLARLEEFVAADAPHQVITANVDFLRLAKRDRTFQDLINTSDLVVPDGMPLVWAARLSKTPLPQRISGVELMLECAAIAAQKGYRIFLLGAAPGVADEVKQVLQDRYPGLRGISTYSPAPPLDEFEEAECVRRVRVVRPHFLFVAFGAPRQDRWIRAHLGALQVPVSIGVGGSFDILAGHVKRAPVWMQKRGLEWFFRFIQEPRRLFKRYFFYDLPVFVELLLESRRIRISQSVPEPTPEPILIERHPAFHLAFKDSEDAQSVGVSGL